MKQFVLITLTSLMVGLITSCKKIEHSIKPELSSPEKSDFIISDAHEFFDKLATKINSSKSFEARNLSFKNTIEKSPLWENAYISAYKKSPAVVIPIKYDKAMSFKSNFSEGKTFSLEEQSRLWIYKDASGEFTAEVVTIIPGKLNKLKNDTSFSGYVLEEDWSGNSIFTSRYADGKVKKIKPLTTTQNRLNPDCEIVMWYECDDIDDWGNGTGCTFLYSEYINCYDIEDPNEGGGGGGGGNGNEDPPFATCESNANAIFSTASVRAEKMNVENCGTTSNTRTKCYNWKIYSVSSGLIPMYLKSKETGVQSKNMNNLWRFDSFTHSDVTKGGTEILYSVNVSSVTPTPAIDMLNYPNDIARMHLGFTVSISVICQGMPIIFSDPTSTQCAWNSNE